MSKVEARLGRVECTVRVSWAPETVNRSTVIAVPESVQWTAFLYVDAVAEIEAISRGEWVAR